MQHCRNTHPPLVQLLDQLLSAFSRTKTLLGVSSIQKHPPSSKAASAFSSCFDQSLRSAKNLRYQASAMSQSTAMPCPPVCVCVCVCVCASVCVCVCKCVCTCARLRLRQVPCVVLLFSAQRKTTALDTMLLQVLTYNL